MKLPPSYYRQTDVVALAEDLLGKFLVTNINGTRTSGIITETEAYAGVNDRASHAYGNRRTARTETMYQNGGLAYVYLCYGLHHLFNVVTNVKDVPHAILVRAVQPSEGIDLMLERRKLTTEGPRLSGGPATLSQALGITVKHNKTSLNGHVIWLEDRGIRPSKDQITVGPRVGVDYAGEDAKLPYRFRLSL
ncbi:MAG: DNA-3-methyladenine glycosylase [Flavobacteriales bacterium]|nr:DNA-3-methyladenine glycosylase [Flavobacteriales bacterium]MCB9448142.1 DNA-3-methyladenine glycosylase [Flavobacteriales bacterium]